MDDSAISTSTKGNQSGLKALGVFTMVYMLSGFLGLSVAPLLPFIQEDLGLDRTELGLFISLLYLGSIATGFLAGLLSDRWSIYKTLLVGLLLEGIMIGGVWLVTTFPNDAGFVFPGWSWFRGC